MKNMILAFCLLFTTTTAFAQQANTITAVGTSEVQVEPTMAIYSMTVVTKGATVKEAQTLNATKSSAVLQALVADFSVQKKDLKNTVQVQKNHIYKDGQSIEDGYIARNSISVRVYDLTTLGQIVDVTGGFGAETGYITYGLVDAQAAKSQALDLAARNAQVNAQALLQPYGKAVGDLVSIVQSGAQTSSIRAYAMEAAMDSGVGAPGGASTSVNAGQITVTATVTVVFSIK